MSGYHLFVDANSSYISPRKVRRILRDICKLADMKQISKVYGVNGAEYNQGFSANLFIEFSNTFLHTFDKGNKHAVNFDLFSCRKFNIKKIINYLQENGFENMDINFINRKIKI